MKRFALSIVVPVLAIFLRADSGVNGQSRRPVLVELFTSEGCSSCPPADALLEALDKVQPVPGAEILALSEHVDYWNHDGWRDPFSSALFTKRQRSYADHLHIDDVYTPQAVIDGAAQVNGSDKKALLQAVQQASRAASLDVHLTELPDARFEVKVEPLPSSAKGDASVLVAIADATASADVNAGENKGRHLHHVDVVRSLSIVGKVSAKSGFTKELPWGEHPEHQRIIAFIQDSKGRILGSAMIPKNMP